MIFSPDFKVQKTYVLYCLIELFKGDRLTRSDLGLPVNWDIVHQWIDDTRFTVESGPKKMDTLSVKNAEIVNFGFV